MLEGPLALTHVDDMECVYCEVMNRATLLIFKRPNHAKFQCKLGHLMMKPFQDAPSIGHRGHWCKGQ